MSKLVISSRQLTYLIASTLITASIINDPQQLARSTGHDAVFSYALALLYGLGIGYVFYALARRYPGKNLFEISFLLAGKWGGGFINLLLMLNIWFVFVRDSYTTTTFLRTTLLQRTPPEILLLLFISVIIYYGQTSIEVTARVNEIVFPFIFIVLIGLPLLLLNEISLTQWEPLFTQPGSQLVLGNLLNAARFGDLIVIGAFLHTIANSRHLLTAIRYGAILSGMILTIVVATSMAVFGADIVARLNFPFYSLVSQIHITDFLDRLDVFMFSLYFPSAVINVVFSFMAFLVGLSAFTGKKDHTPYSRSMGWFFLLVIPISFRNIVELTQFTFFAYPFFVLLTQPVLLVCLFVLGVMRKRRAPIQDHEDNTSQQAESSHHQSGGRYGKNSLRIWMRLTHFFMLAALLLIIAGVWLGKAYSWAGAVCSLGYGLCLIAIFITSTYERRQAGAG
ncbi:GerAB/ArcD/ProY family transporter [Paenibacillus senegalensis]|uniref:GerAB/ArcD/ProY family transporter n=1 Tax=Paenibacillus senegalensis TaxID=1465766 RepID=UPI0002DBF396|nr:endospore germination permease [Paenibacillus senegalensis]